MKPTNQQILDSIQRVYILSESLVSELIWLKSYCKPEYIKIINEAKAKVNHLKKVMISDMTPEAKEMVEEIAFTFHEKVMEVINPKEEGITQSTPNNLKKEVPINRNLIDPYTGEKLYPSIFDDWYGGDK